MSSPKSAPKLRNVAPMAGAEAAVRAGRSYGETIRPSSHSRSS